MLIRSAEEIVRGREFGCLLVKEIFRVRRGYVVLVYCHGCDRLVEMPMTKLRSGINSCGCQLKKPRDQGGLCAKYQAEYQAWRCMIRKGSKLGIPIAEDWRESFPNFLNHVGPRPNVHMSLYRFDINGGYEPENVFWATKEEMANHRRPRNSRTLEYSGSN